MSPTDILHLVIIFPWFWELVCCCFCTVDLFSYESLRRFRDEINNLNEVARVWIYLDWFTQWPRRYVRRHINSYSCACTCAYSPDHSQLMSVTHVDRHKQSNRYVTATHKDTQIPEQHPPTKTNLHRKTPRPCRLDTWHWGSGKQLILPVRWFTGSFSRLITTCQINPLTKSSWVTKHLSPH